MCICVREDRYANACRVEKPLVSPTIIPEPDIPAQLHPYLEVQGLGICRVAICRVRSRITLATTLFRVHI